MPSLLHHLIARSLLFRTGYVDKTTGWYWSSKNVAVHFYTSYGFNLLRDRETFHDPRLSMQRIWESQPTRLFGGLDSNDSYIEACVGFWTMARILQHFTPSEQDCIVTQVLKNGHILPKEYPVHKESDSASSGTENNSHSLRFVFKPEHLACLSKKTGA